MKIPFLGQDESGLLQHGALLIIGTFLGALCNVGFHMVVGRPAVLTNAEYGSLVAMLGIILAASTPMQALQITLAHFISQFIQEDRRGEIRPLFRHWAGVFAGLSLALVAAAWAGRAPLAAVWNVPPALIVLTFGVLAASLWMNLFYGLLQGMQWFGWLAWVPQAWGATRLVLGAGFTILLSATAFAAVAAQGFGVLAVMVLGVCALRAMRLPAGSAAARPHETYRYLISSLICLAGYAMLMNLDTTLARHYFDPETVGRFAKAAVIARTAVFLPVPVAAALFPKVTSTGDMTEESWRLLGRALVFVGLMIAAVVAVCVAVPQLPWTILFSHMTPDMADSAKLLTRAMVLAMCPLAVAGLLLNFEMAQRRFFWCYGIVFCGLAYVGGVALFHRHPLQIALVLGGLNLVAVVLLAISVLAQRRKAG